MGLERSVAGMAYEIRLVLQGIYGSQDDGEINKLFQNRFAWVHAIRGQTGELLKLTAAASWMIDGKLGDNLGPLDSRADGRHHGANQQPVFSREAAGP